MTIPMEIPDAARPARIGRAAATYNPVREILTRATGFIGSYDFTLNLYSGCSYCYAAFFKPEPGIAGQLCLTWDLSGPAITSSSGWCDGLG